MDSLIPFDALHFVIYKCINYMSNKVAIFYFLFLKLIWLLSIYYRYNGGIEICKYDFEMGDEYPSVSDLIQTTCCSFCISSFSNSSARRLHEVCIFIEQFMEIDRLT